MRQRDERRSASLEDKSGVGRGWREEVDFEEKHGKFVFS